MKSYTGQRDQQNCNVYVVSDNGVKRKLRKRLDLCNHSATGFNWGYSGSGPAQLALAILADTLGNDELAVRLHESFKFAVIAPIRQDTWQIDEQLIQLHVQKLLSALPVQTMTA